MCHTSAPRTFASSAQTWGIIFCQSWQCPPFNYNVVCWRWFVAIPIARVEQLHLFACSPLAADPCRLAFFSHQVSSLILNRSPKVPSSEALHDVARDSTKQGCARGFNAQRDLTVEIPHALTAYQRQSSVHAPQIWRER